MKNSSQLSAPDSGAEQMTVPWQMPALPVESLELQAEMNRLESEEVRLRDLQKQRELEQQRELARFD